MDKLRIKYRGEVYKDPSEAWDLFHKTPQFFVMTCCAKPVHVSTEGRVHLLECRECGATAVV